LDNHYFAWIALLIFAGLLMFVARRIGDRTDRRLLRASQILFGLTILWAILGLSFDIPSERLHTAHVSLAKAATDHDTAGILTHFSSDFSLPILRIERNNDT